MMPRLAAFACAITLAACGRSSTANDGNWQAERETVGDTTVVRTLSGSVWDAPKEAVVELTIGTAEGPEETMFGFVSQIVPDAGGGGDVFDAQVPAIRYFDAAGCPPGGTGAARPDRRHGGSSPHGTELAPLGGRERVGGGGTPPSTRPGGSAAGVAGL